MKVNKVVANVNVKVKLDHMESIAKSPALLLKGTNLKLQYFDSLFKRISWNDYIQILRNLELHTNHDDIEAIGVKGALDHQYSIVQSLFHALIPLKLLYWAQAKFIGPYLYKNMKYEYSRSSNGLIILKMTADGEAPPQILWDGYRMAYTSFPRLIGSEVAAEVTMMAEGNHATYAIRPVERIPFKTRLRNILRSPQRFKTTIKLLNELQDSELENRILSKKLMEKNLQLKTHLEMLSHDMANSLTLAKTAAHGLEASFTPEKLQTCMRAIDRTIAYTNLSRFQLSDGRYQPMNPISIKESIAMALNELQAIIKNKDITVITKVEENLSISCDEYLFSLSVLANLINNSIKFSNTGAIIRIEAKRVDTSIHIQIEDSGVGIPEERLDQILKKKRMTTHGTHNEEGSGLGLPIVQSIVEQYGGLLKIESTLNVGTKVLIIMPEVTQQTSEQL